MGYFTERYGTPKKGQSMHSFLNEITKPKTTDYSSDYSVDLAALTEVLTEASRRELAQEIQARKSNGDLDVTKSGTSTSSSHPVIYVRDEVISLMLQDNRLQFNDRRLTDFDAEAKGIKTKNESDSHVQKLTARAMKDIGLASEYPRR